MPEAVAPDLDLLFPAALALPVKMLVLDVDGVLTDGGLYYGDQGLAIKRFDVQDGLGIKLAQQVGLEFSLISGMESAALRQRARDLGISECYAGSLDKLPILQDIMRRKGLDWPAVACLGDDLPDLPLLRRAGLALAVQNAQPEVRRAAHYVSPLFGGRGAVRQILRQILLAQGRLEELLARFTPLAEQGAMPAR